jgi:hypothetical protein
MRNPLWKVIFFIVKKAEEKASMIFGSGVQIIACS